MSQSPSNDSLPPTMLAQHLTAFHNPYVLTRVPLPTPSDPHDLLIRVTAASYCHTDAVLAAGQMPPFPLSFPHVSCHEFAGVVAALPPSYTGPYKVGDHVGVPGRSFHPCGTCFECARGPDDDNADADEPGYSVYCAGGAGNNGISVPGGFREFAVVDSRQVAPVPEGMTSVQAAVLMCAGLTIYAALKRCDLKPGQRVAIMGCGGGLGHLGLQFAAAMGLRVLGVDVAEGPLGLAKEVASAAKGETTQVRIANGLDTKAAELVQEMGAEDGKTQKGEAGADAVIILPESQAAFDYGVALLRNHGRCAVVSFPEKGFHVSAWDIVFRDISVVGSLVGSNKVLREMLRFAADHGVRARIKTFPLSGLNDLVAEYHKGVGGKLAIDMALPNVSSE